MTYKLPFFVLVFLSTFCIGQNISDYKTMSVKSNANFFTIVNTVRAEFATKDLSIRENRKAFKQFERWAYDWNDRVNADGSFPSVEQTRDVNQIIYNTLESRQLNEENTPAAAWTQIGPVANPAVNGYAAFPGKGRINVVAMDPTNTQIMYAGSPAGGLWKSTDGGSSWMPKTDDFAGLGVTDILVDPNSTSTIYLATGDRDGTNISSIGLFKSTDGGDSWSPTGLTFTLSQNEYIRDLAFDPTNSQRIFALTNREIQISTDGGATFTNTSVDTGGFTFTENFTNIIFRPNDAQQIYVTDFFGGLYRSTDGGANFALHQVFQGGNNKDLIKIVATPADNNFYYAISQNGEFRKYRYDWQNNNSDLISTNAISGYNSQGGFNQCITVSPTNASNIFIGGVRGYRSDDGGSNFVVALNPYNDPPGAGYYVHPDHHFMQFLPDGDTIINGHDGGIHRFLFSQPTNNGTDLSPGLIITQSYNIAITQASNGDDFMMANQDNDGFSKVEKNGVRQWVSALAGDGTSTEIDFNTPLTRYLGGTQGQLSRTDDGYSSSFNSATAILAQDGNAAFVSPSALHPTVPTTIYVGHDDVKVSTDRGDNFTTLNSGINTVSHLNVTSFNGSIRIAALNEAGLSRISLDNGSTWTTVTAPNGRMFNSFSGMPNTATIFGTVKAYNAADKVFKSVDNGATWTNITGNLPNIIMKEIFTKVDTTNETLFLATELGVYWKNNDSQTDWTKLGTNLPNVRVDDLKLNYTDQQLFAGTYGRGMWKIPVDTNVLGTEENVLSSNDAPKIFPNPVSGNILKINLSATTLSNKNAYTIYNYVGGIVRQGNLDLEQNVVNTAGIASGLYLINVVSNDKVFSQKIIIE